MLAHGVPADRRRGSADSVPPLLALRNTGVSFISGHDHRQVTKDVSFNIEAGETLAIVGESGCGKSVTALSILGLLPAGRSLIQGRIEFEGASLLDEVNLRKVRGREIGMIFQEPMSALDPVFTIGEQISETIRRHLRVDRRSAREQAIEALEAVKIADPHKRYHDYPMQLSGGMLQRVMIAQALSCHPKLLIADEPTTALDVTIQAQILNLLYRRVNDTGTALLLITHDLGVVAETCSRMLTMYAGEVVEHGTVADILRRPRHPYTSGLLACLPRGAAPKSLLPSIPGVVPSPDFLPDGCRFESRCAYAAEACRQPQELAPLSSAHYARCGLAAGIELPGVAA